LQNLPLAQEVVDQNLQALEDFINGDVLLVASLPSGAIVRKGDPDFQIKWDEGTGKVANVTSYTITKIRKFSNNRLKITMVMDSDPTQVIEVDDPYCVIQDWWPAEGDSSTEYINAMNRAAKGQ